MGNTGEARGVTDIGRSVLKSVVSLSKNKADETVAAAVSAATPAPANDATMISINVEMTGTIVSSDALCIAGRVEGNVRAAAVTVMATGSVRGDIIADTVTVHGAVEGRIHGAKVHLCAGANVRGDLVHGVLAMDEGALFEGNSKRDAAGGMADVPDFAVQGGWAA